MRRYDVLDTPPDGAFDRVAALAARFYAVPIATVTIVDEQRIWFRARHGLGGVSELGRDPGLCASVILDDVPYLVTDARLDPRTLNHPLVRGEFGLRFYAAAPIITQDGYRLGTVNVMDRAPRNVADDMLGVLQDLAAVVANDLELQLAALRMVQAEQLASAQLAREKAQAEQIAGVKAELARQLRWALDHRVVIEQAKGALMAREGLDERAAFERLRGYARSVRRPVDEVALEVLKGVALPPPVATARPRRRRR